MLVPLSNRIWTLLGELGIVRLLGCFDRTPIRDSLTLARSYKVNFHTKDSLGGSHTILMIVLCHECLPMAVSIERPPFIRQRYASAT